MKLGVLGVHVQIPRGGVQPQRPGLAEAARLLDVARHLVQETLVRLVRFDGLGGGCHGRERITVLKDPGIVILLYLFLRWLSFLLFHTDDNQRYNKIW